MAGRTASNVITRYAGIQVQTSAMGLQIPLGWGQFRVNCNMLDYLDFKSKPQTAKGAARAARRSPATAIPPPSSWAFAKVRSTPSTSSMSTARPIPTARRPRSSRPA